MGGQTLTEIINDVLDSDGNLKPGFCGIGRLRGKTTADYSEDEQTVLGHFFTNLHSNVYCATDNMPGEMWALVMGQYARSNMTGRDRLLKLFKDMAKSEKVSAPSVAEIAEMIRAGDEKADMLKEHIKRAGLFIEEYGVKYGHASLRDSGTIRICFEGVSQRATKFLESAREGAYQEQSTRALPFKMDNLGIPYEVKGTKYEQMMLDLDKKLIDLYERVYDGMLVHLEKKFAHKREEADAMIAEALGSTDFKMRDRVWKGIIAGKAFDVARYLLPQNMTTSLGITLNTRRFQDQLTEWRSEEMMEMQVLGKVAQVEAKKISPMLMKHGEPSKYHSKIRPALRELNKKFVDGSPVGRDFQYKHYDCESRMIEAPDNLQEMVLASILLNGSDGSRTMEELMEIVGKMSYEEKREIAESVTKDKQSFEIFNKSMEVGGVVFERVYDIGAYRDLQRQRGDRQQINRYSVIGYNMPKELIEMGMDDEFKAMMQEVKDMYDLFRKEGLHAAAEYVPVMANVLRHVVTMDPVQQFYQAKLRAQPAGIDSYRAIAQQEMGQLLEIMPVFKGLIPYDEEYYDLGRLPESVRMEIDHFKKKQAA